MGRTSLALAAAIGLTAGACAGHIVEDPDKDRGRYCSCQTWPRGTEADRIVEDLLGDNFQRKNAAREKLHKLSVQQRQGTMMKLLESADTSDRLLAVSELAKLKDSPGVTDILEKVAAEDPSSTVKQVALMALGRGGPVEDQGGEEGDEEDAEEDEEGGEAPTPPPAPVPEEPAPVPERTDIEPTPSPGSDHAE